MHYKESIGKMALIALGLIIFASMAFSISADSALAIVSVQNNYLMPNETASVLNGMITYKGEKYIIVAAQGNSTINAYIPVKSSTGEIASQDVEVSELVKTTIIYTKMNQLNQSIPAANWPFSYSTKSYFTDSANDFGALMNSILTVGTELKKINDPAATQLATTAETTQGMADDLAAESTKMADQLDNARVFEQNFFNNPDTNKTSNYENYYSGYFGEMQTIKDKFNALDTKLSELTQGIGALETTKITVDQKGSFQRLLALPTNPKRMPDLFSTTDQLRTEIESVFNEGKNSGGFTATLATRKVRNEAWLLLYGNNAELIKLDKSFVTLQKAANAVLSTDNVDLWENQDAVMALKTNWAGAESRFNNAEYDKAKNFATNAQQNVKQIISGGVKPTVDNTSDIMVKAIIGLVVLVIVIFVVQNLILKKKKKEDEYDPEQYK